MLPFLVLLLTLGTMAQRPPYAGSRPPLGLLPRFRTTEGTPTNQNTTDSSLANREGEIPAAPALPSELQGTLEEDGLVNRVAEWPEERQPFWFKNRNTLNNNRLRPIDGNQAKEEPPQSPFLGETQTRAFIPGQRNFNQGQPINLRPRPIGGNRINQGWNPQNERWSQNQRNDWRHQRPINSGQRSYLDSTN